MRRCATITYKRTVLPSGLKVLGMLAKRRERGWRRRVEEGRRRTKKIEDAEKRERI